MSRPQFYRIPALALPSNSLLGSYRHGRTGQRTPSPRDENRPGVRQHPSDQASRPQARRRGHHIAQGTTRSHGLSRRRHTRFSHPIKPVSDVWSFAASLYQLLTGKFPYRFDPKRDPIDIILNENPVPIRDRMPGLTKDIAAVIDKALVRNPKDRFPDAGKLLASLPKPRP